jgi:hypothetical protein
MNTRNYKKLCRKNQLSKRGGNTVEQVVIDGKNVGYRERNEEGKIVSTCPNHDPGTETC